ncbi:MAG: hypothetical protein H7281_18715 [Bacteriovorax sp.]|nr:hypothetical protein [Bacteriovorax sp.]
MNKNWDLNQVTAFVLKAKKSENSREFHRVYDLSFKAWHETWQKTYQMDFNSPKSLNSDTFTRQDDVLSLFYKGECFAVCIFTHLNMTDEYAHHDSYFNCWPEDAIKALCARGPNIITCTQYTVCENFRGEGPTSLGKNPWRTLITAMIGKYFLKSGKDAMSAITRVNKGIDKVSYKNGGIQLVEGLEFEAGSDKTLVDLVVFFPDEVLEIYDTNPYSEYFEELWENRNGRALIIAA